MKRVLCWLIVMVSMCSSSAIADGGAVIDEVSTMNALPFEMREYVESPNDNNTVRIRFPFFTHVDGYIINDIIFNNISVMIVEYNVRYGFMWATDINYESEVTFNNGKWLSIVFWGELHVKNGRTDSVIYTVNIDLDTYREHRFVDLFDIDDGFRDVIAAHAMYPHNPSTSPIDNNIFDEQVLPYLDMVEQFYPLEMVCYIKPEGIVVSIPVGHVLNDRVDVYLDYRFMLPYYRLPNPIWDE